MYGKAKHLSIFIRRLNKISIALFSWSRLSKAFTGVKKWKKADQKELTQILIAIGLGLW